MLEQTIINHVDVLVHSEYGQLGLSDTPPIPNSEQNRMRDLWQERALIVARNPNAIIIHHSYFIDYDLLDNGQAKTLVNTHERPDLWMIERERMRDFKRLLGDRYIVLGGTFYPTSVHLAGILTSRGLSIDSKNGQVLAYGEYFKRCVKYWGENIAMTTLEESRWPGRPRTGYSTSELLSVKARE